MRSAGCRIHTSAKLNFRRFETETLFGRSIVKTQNNQNSGERTQRKKIVFEIPKKYFLLVQRLE